MQSNLQKWGNSLGVRIPSHIAQKLSLHPGTIVNIVANDQQISIIPKKYTLSDMLSKITKENIHNLEWDGSDEVGLEEW
jgi:antitoxin MazE